MGIGVRGGCLFLTREGCLRLRDCAPNPNTDPCVGGCCHYFYAAFLGSADHASPTTWHVDSDDIVHITVAPTGYADLIKRVEIFDCDGGTTAVTRLADGQWQWIIGDGDAGTLTSTSALLACPPTRDPTGTLWTYTRNLVHDSFDSKLTQVYCRLGAYSDPATTQTLLVAGVIGVVISEKAPVLTWNSATAYSVGDKAVSGSRVYRANHAHTNHAPPNVSYWDDYQPVLSGSLTGVAASSRQWVSVETSGGGYGAILMGDGRYWSDVRLVADITPGSSQPKASLDIDSPSGISGQWATFEGRWYDPMGAINSGDMTDFALHISLGEAP